MELSSDITALKELIKSTPKPQFIQKTKKKEENEKKVGTDIPPFATFTNGNNNNRPILEALLHNDLEHATADTLQPNFQSMWFSGDAGLCNNPIFTLPPKATHALDLSNSTLRNVNLSGCNLAPLTLTHSDMSGSIIHRDTTRLSAHMAGVTLCSAVLTGVDFIDVDMADANIHKATIAGARFPEGFTDQVESDTNINAPPSDTSELDLSEHGLARVPASYEHHNIATTLNLSRNSISHISPSFGRFPMLTTLNLAQNALTEIPECIFHLPRLRMLDLSKNSITSVAPGIERLAPSLEHLNIADNRLEALPDALGALRLLSFLNLGNNALRGVPAAVCAGLQKLQRLYLDGNALEALPENFGDLGGLSTLIAKGNRLKTLPKSFGRLENLVSCCLSENEIEAIPPEACENLKSLSIFILSNNRLRTLPETLGNVRVSSLILDHNEFGTVPEVLVDMRSIKILLLSFNNIEDVPQRLYALDNSRKIYIHNNPCSRIYGQRRIPNLFC